MTPNTISNHLLLFQIVIATIVSNLGLTCLAHNGGSDVTTEDGIVSESSADFETDRIVTNNGEKLQITFIGHGTLMIQYEDKIIHIDPWTKMADYTKLPKADIILITHEHQDHLDPKAVELLQQESTRIILTKVCKEKITDGIVTQNGDTRELFDNVNLLAIPAYNLVHKRPSGEPFHPKGRGNGYIIDFKGTHIYIAGDTENISEMKALKNIDVAFLPMNLPYTMTPEMVADAVKAFKPKILYPYYYGDTDVNDLIELMADQKDTEVRIRKLK